MKYKESNTKERLPHKENQGIHTSKRGTRTEQLEPTTTSGSGEIEEYEETTICQRLRRYQCNEEISIRSIKRRDKDRVQTIRSTPKTENGKRTNRIETQAISTRQTIGDRKEARPQKTGNKAETPTLYRPNQQQGSKHQKTTDETQNDVMLPVRKQTSRSRRGSNRSAKHQRRIQRHGPDSRLRRTKPPTKP
ncbi:predicted protein [Arabidopsis lyrata subsp. lyrata]|uniref:Predicted protein n=1 Tax=Arabidopsis lyrata subsp. lyrata TaxID=81972 RepID=D7LYR2_ARALL|nr:predicted protein [Arabidopsis lyrata subsp. lyrata]